MVWLKESGGSDDRGVVSAKLQGRNIQKNFQFTIFNFQFHFVAEAEVGGDAAGQKNRLRVEFFDSFEDLSDEDVGDGLLKLVSKVHGSQFTVHSR